MIQAEFNLSSVKITQTDYNLAYLARVVNRPEINEIIVRSWIDLAWRRRRTTLVFAVDVEHVQALVAEFSQRGVEARGIDSGTPYAKRQCIMDEFSRGVFPVLINCGVSTLISLTQPY